MKIHCIRHEPFEGLAMIKDWICSNRHTVTFTHIYLNQEFPEVGDFDMLIVMGGTASVNDDTPHINEELSFIKRVITTDKPVLGICLGAQMIAYALGAKVYAGIEKEIGWYPINISPEAQNQLPFLPGEHVAFHWHGDTFDIPINATPLGSSKVTPNQGFIFGKKVIALQFHLEMTPESIVKIVNGARHEIDADNGKYIQSAKQILHEQSFFEANNNLIFQILDYLVK